MGTKAKNKNKKSIEKQQDQGANLHKSTIQDSQIPMKFDLY